MAENTPKAPQQNPPNGGGKPQQPQAQPNNVGPRPAGESAAPAAAAAPAPAPGVAQYDGKGNLSRASMEAAIRGGGSVLHKGRLVTRVEDLPSEADLASGNPDEADRVRRQNEEQIRKLQDENSRLKSDAAAARKRQEEQQQDGGGENPPPQQ